jgi:hypothetical protein
MDTIFSKLIKRVTAGLLASVVFLASASMSAAANPNVTVLAFGLFGAQSVFESEAKGAAASSRSAWGEPSRRACQYENP